MQSKIFDRHLINVGENERPFSVALGSALLFEAIREHSLRSIFLGLMGGELLYRGITAHCHLYGAIDRSTADETASRSRKTAREKKAAKTKSMSRGVYEGFEANDGHARSDSGDIVDEAGDESFPASDPPSWTPGEI